MTNYDDLMAHHDRVVTSQVKKYLSNIHYKMNINDVPWLLEGPSFQKQFGRAQRIYNRIEKLRN